MKKKEGKVLKSKLLAAVIKVLKDNHIVDSSKVEKTLEKSVKNIVRKSNHKKSARKKAVLVK